MKLLIAGRTGSGKDTVAKMLAEKYGWKIVCSYTTRERRPEEGDTHIFITHEEAAAIPDSEKAAITFINNGKEKDDEYFTTYDQIRECDAYIIDPKGIEELLCRMPDQVFEILYLEAPSMDKMRDIILARSGGDEAELENFHKRYDSENEQFTEFEKALRENNFGNHKSCSVCMYEQNDYTEDFLNRVSAMANERKNLHDNMTKIASEHKHDMFQHVGEDGTIYVTQKDNEESDYYEEPYTDEQIASLIIADPEPMYSIMKIWLASAPLADSPFKA